MFRWFTCALLLLAPLVTTASAEKGKLRERLTPAVMAAVYPGAERLGPEEGSPPAIAVYKGGKVAAYVFSTLDIVAAVGYSATPFDVIGGVHLEGRITGAKVIAHAEPYIVNDQVRTRRLDTFLDREAGQPLRGGRGNALTPDFVAGATISARAMRAALLETGRLVLRTRSARAAVTVPTLDTESFTLMSWQELLATGALVRRRITSGEVAAALAKAGVSEAVLDVPLGKPDELYVEIIAGLYSPRTIGGSLLGLLNFEEYKRRLPLGALAIIVASNGPYDFMGTKYFREAEGYRFDRLRLVQRIQTFQFVRADYQRIGTGRGAEGIRGQQDAGLFAVAAGSGFDPLEPWRLELLVNGAGSGAVSIPFSLDYKLPTAHVLMPTALMPDVPDPPTVAPWVEAWHDSRLNVVLLALLLAALTLVFVFQDALARHRTAHRLVRNGFLVIVLVWLGWTAGAQLSIVNIINYIRGPLAGVDVGFYLAEPLMIVLAAYTLLSVLLIGRGVFCGWLCPFGALQELLGQAARALGVPQWSPPAALAQRLWWGKYIAAAVVLTLALTAIDPSGASTEIEPFKTAIISKFTRAWPFVLYAGALLAVGLVCERAYCRFLCPLGGVLALLDRLHLIDRLRRRPECGSPCRLCERACPVRAIAPSGRIVTAECFQCLDCQVEYHDETRCPPLARAAKSRGGPAQTGATPVAAAVEHA